MDWQNNTKVVEHLYASFGAGDLDGMLGTLTEDVTFEIPKLPGVALRPLYRGKEGVRQFLKDREPTLRYDQFTPREFVAQGDIVIVLGETQAVALATGKEFQFQWAQVFRFREGRIASFQEYLDTADLGPVFCA